VVHFGIDHPDPLLTEPVIKPVDIGLVAGDVLRREQHRIAFLQFDSRVGSTGDPGQRRPALALAAGDQIEQVLARNIAHPVFRHHGWKIGQQPG